MNAATHLAGLWLDGFSTLWIARVGWNALLHQSRLHGDYPHIDSAQASSTRHHTLTPSAQILLERSLHVVHRTKYEQTMYTTIEMQTNKEKKETYAICPHPEHTITAKTFIAFLVGARKREHNRKAVLSLITSIHYSCLSDGRELYMIDTCEITAGCWRYEFD